MRILHTMIRVGNLDRSIAFYTEVLGMRLLRRDDYPEGRFTLAFVGYGEESESAVIELTFNWDTASYDLGNGFGHIALEVPDAHAAWRAIPMAMWPPMPPATPSASGAARSRVRPAR